jgi:hypothetical protein
MNKKTALLAALFLTGLLVFTTCKEPEPEIRYVEVPIEVPVEVEVEVPGETVYVEVPNVCDNPAECARGNLQKIEGHRSNELADLCITNGCSVDYWREVCYPESMNAYSAATMGSWVERSGGIHEMTKGVDVAPFSYVEPFSGKNVFPCLEDADLQAGLTAAMNKLNEIHAQE